MDENGKKIQMLLANFTEASRVHYDATLAGDWRTANVQAKIFHKSFIQLANLGPEARKALLDLVDTETLPVAVMAAVYSLKFSPERALATLQKIAKEPGFVGFEAEQAIKRWTEGSWQLE